MYQYYFVSKRTQIATNSILIGLIVNQTNIYQAHGNPVILFEPNILKSELQHRQTEKETARQN